MTCHREKELLEQIEQTGEMYRVSALQLIKAGKRIADLESLNGALCRDSAGFVQERDALAARVEVMRDALSSVTQYAEVQICGHDETYRGGAIWEICHSCGAKWADDEGGKPTFQWAAPIIQARESIALPDLSADILRARDARNGAYEMRRGARVIELFDDATMKGDHMLDSSECASILNALADELEQAK